MKATRKQGKPYIWVTWLASLLGGRECVWAVWFKARHKYEKFEAQASDLAKWNHEHNALMKRRKLELEGQGYTVDVEDANAFKLEGEAAVIAGKPDLIGKYSGTEAMPAHSLLVDGKTGRRRDSDFWQVLIYLFAVPRCEKGKTLPGGLIGELQYKSNNERQTIEAGELTSARQSQIVSMIKIIGNDGEEPRRVPSKDECFKCNIGPDDCPERFKDPRISFTKDF